MRIPFNKYHGTGNDFVILDGKKQSLPDLTRDQVSGICHRRYGIGADGLMIIRSSYRADFEMIYYNSDGTVSSLCGNGSRCIVRYAYETGYIGKEGKFLAIDGIHDYLIEDDVISIHMSDISHWSEINGCTEIDTGSPHYVVFCETLPEGSIVDMARAIRNNDKYKDDGINVDFVASTDQRLSIRTYERGVENETLSCGTGVVAAALSHGIQLPNGIHQISVEAVGGQLMVRFKKDNNGFTDVWLCGPAAAVYSGTYDLTAHS